MICFKCLKKIPEDSLFCHYCGTEIESRNLSELNEINKNLKESLYRRLRKSIILAIILSSSIATILAFLMPEKDFTRFYYYQANFLGFIVSLSLGLSFLLWYSMKNLVRFVKRPFASLSIMAISFFFTGYFVVGSFAWFVDEGEIDPNAIIILILITLPVAIAQTTFMNKFLKLDPNPPPTKFCLLTFFLYIFGLPAFGIFSWALFRILNSGKMSYFKVALPISFALAMIFFHTVNTIRALRFLKMNKFRGIEVSEERKQANSPEAGFS